MIYKREFSTQSSTNESAAATVAAIGCGGLLLTILISEWRRKHKPLGFTVLTGEPPKEFNEDTLSILNNVDKNLKNKTPAGLINKNKHLDDTRCYTKSIEKCRNEIKDNKKGKLFLKIKTNSALKASNLLKIASKSLQNSGFELTPPYTKDQSFFKSLVSSDSNRYLYKKYTDDIYCIAEANVDYTTYYGEETGENSINYTFVCIDINDGKNKVKMHMETFNFIDSIEFM